MSAASRFINDVKYRVICVDMHLISTYVLFVVNTFNGMLRY